MQRIITYSILLVSLVLLAGCARFPAGVSATSVREMAFQITFNGPVNDNYYYNVAIDTTGGANGPVAVFPNPEVQAVDDWVTGSANYFVQYHARQFTLCKITQLHPFTYMIIGAPLKYILPDPGSNELTFSVDLNSIAEIGSSLNINIITLNQLAPSGRLLDALGPRGTTFVNVGITSNRTYRNSDLGTPEAAYDVLDQNGALFANQTDPQVTPLDITDWSIVVNK